MCLSCYFFDRFLLKEAAARIDPRWMAGADSSYPVVRDAPAKTIVIEGKILDQKHGTPLAYVNKRVGHRAEYRDPDFQKSEDQASWKQQPVDTERYIFPRGF